MKGITKIVVLSFIAIVLWSCGGEEASVYHYPSSFYRNNQLKLESIALEPYEAKQERDSQNVTIGWHPYHLKDAYKSYDFSLLHTVIFNGYEWRGDHTEAVIDAWYETEMVDEARNAGCKVLFSASNYGALRTKSFFDSTSLQMDFIDEVLAYLKMKNADGIELDFPAVSRKNRNDLTNFVKTLYIKLKQSDLDAELYMSLPFFDDNNAFDIKAISPYVNLFIIGGNNNANINYSLGDNEPIAPIENPYNDSASIAGSYRHYSGKGISPFKVILELPYYTTIKQKEDIGQDSFEYYNNFLTYDKFMKDYGHQEIFYDAEAYSSFVKVANPEGEGDLKLYFDDSTSLGAKYDWALSHGFRGVGLWSLGYDNGHKELWKMLESRSQRVPSMESAASPFSVGSYFSRNYSLFQIWMTLVVFLTLLAAVIAMLYWKSRDSLTHLRSFKLYFIIIGGFLGFLVFAKLDFLGFPFLVMIIGIALGAAMTYFINGYINRRIEREP